MRPHVATVLTPRVLKVARAGTEREQHEHFTVSQRRFFPVLRSRLETTLCPPASHQTSQKYRRAGRSGSGFTAVQLTAADGQAHIWEGRSRANEPGQNRWSHSEGGDGIRGLKEGGREERGRERVL